MSGVAGISEGLRCATPLKTTRGAERVFLRTTLKSDRSNQRGRRVQIGSSYYREYERNTARHRARFQRRQPAQDKDWEGVTKPPRQAFGWD